MKSPMTPARAQSTIDLLRDLVASYCRRPDEIEISTKAVPGAFYARLTVHGTDHPAVVGRRGEHVKALTKIFVEIGKAAGCAFSLELTEPKNVAGRVPLDLPDPAENFNPEPARELLRRILEALGFGQFAIESAFAPFPKFEHQSLKFSIFVRGEDDYLRLIVSDDRHDALIACLGTIYRAAGITAGVKFTIEARKS